MPLPNSETHLACQNCGALWVRNSDIYFFYLSPRIGGGLVSTNDISAAGLNIERCPKCPLPGVEEGRVGEPRFREGDPPHPYRTPVLGEEP